MPISPWYIGQTLPVWQCIVQKDDKTFLDLTNSTPSVTFRNVNGLTDRAQAGTWFLNNPTQGQAQYTVNSADVTVAGQYKLVFRFTYSAGIAICDPVDWLLQPD